MSISSLGQLPVLPVATAATDDKHTGLFLQREFNTTVKKTSAVSIGMVYKHDWVIHHMTVSPLSVSYFN